MREADFDSTPLMAAAAAAFKRRGRSQARGAFDFSKAKAGEEQQALGSHRKQSPRTTTTASEEERLSSLISTDFNDLDEVRLAFSSRNTVHNIRFTLSL